MQYSGTASGPQDPFQSNCCASTGTAPSAPCNKSGGALLPRSVSFSYLCEASPLGNPAIATCADSFPGFSASEPARRARDHAKLIVSRFGRHLAWFRVYAGKPVFSLEDDTETKAVFEALIELGVEADPNYLIVQGSQRGHKAVVELGLELSAGAVAGKAGGWWAESLSRAIAEAVAIGSVEIAQLLFDHGARVRPHTLMGGPGGTDAVYRAASLGHDAMANWLISVAHVYGPPSI